MMKPYKVNYFFNGTYLNMQHDMISLWYTSTIMAYVYTLLLFLILEMWYFTLIPIRHMCTYFVIITKLNHYYKSAMVIIRISHPMNKQKVKQ